MELYLDTADVAAVKRLARVLPLQGVTTNPSILAKAGKPIWEVLPALRDALGEPVNCLPKCWPATVNSWCQRRYYCPSAFPVW